MSTEKKADFSDVTAKVETTADKVEKADFSDVTAKVDTTAEVVEQTYTIGKGDTLSKIAKEHYGSANAWQQIFEANRDIIEDPDRIFPGQVIKLPPKSPGA